MEFRSNNIFSCTGNINDEDIFSKAVTPVNHANIMVRIFSMIYLVMEASKTDNTSKVYQYLKTLKSYINISFVIPAGI